MHLRFLTLRDPAIPRGLIRQLGKSTMTIFTVSSLIVGGSVKLTLKHLKPSILSKLLKCLSCVVK
jgi:hypothetical protein